MSLKEKEDIAYEVAIRLGQYFAYIATTWHEILTWFGYKSAGFIPEFQSSFTWEDKFNSGLFWWGATFIDSSIENAADCFRAHALFDDLGVALPALDVFSRCQSGNQAVDSA